MELCIKCQEHEQSPRRKICLSCLKKEQSEQRRRRRQVVGSKAYTAHQYDGVRERAIKRGKTFNLTLEEFRELYNNRTSECPYCNLTMVYPTIDRIDNLKGYTVTNCLIVCRDCNRLKNNIDADKILRMAEAIRKTRGS